MHTVPFIYVGAIKVEDLDTAVGSIAHIDPFIGADCDGMWVGELARTITRAAPSETVFAVGAENVDASITVAVADVEVAIWCNGDTCRLIKWLSAHLRGGFVGSADNRQQVATYIKFSYSTVPIIHAIYSAIRT